MSKTTKKLGKPQATFHLTVDAVVEPTQGMMEQQRYLDRVAQRLFKGRHYFKLGEKEKTFLHEVVNGLGADSNRHNSAREDLDRAGLMERGAK